MLIKNNRKEIVEKIAKQIAMFEGQIIEKANSKRRAELMTIAQSILATVERLGGAKDYE